MNPSAVGEETTFVMSLCTFKQVCVCVCVCVCVWAVSPTLRLLSNMAAIQHSDGPAQSLAGRGGDSSEVHRISWNK